MAGYARGHNVLKVAALAVISAVLFGAMFIYMTGRGLSIRQSDVFVRLATAEGLKKHDKVFFRGVEVGIVRKLVFERDGTVLVRAHIMEPLPLTTDATATLVALDLFGNQSLVLKEGSLHAPRLLDDDTISGTPPVTLTMQADEIGRNAQRLTGDTTVVLLHEALAGAGDAARSFAALGAEMRSLIAAQRESMSLLSNNAALVTANLAQATDPAPIVAMRENIAHTTHTLTTIAARLDTTSVAMASIVASLEQGNGTAGRLLNDPALYERADVMLTSLDALLKDLKSNPKRYFSIF
jgi:phospholipid/cholesterol/gamma-HCH transport system substrate-binding protein